MATLVGESTATLQQGMGLGWTILKILVIVGLPILVIAGVAYVAYWLLMQRRKTLFGRRRVEIEKSAMASKSPEIKDVYMYDAGQYRKVGQYLGHVGLDVVADKELNKGKAVGITAIVVESNPRLWLLDFFLGFQLYVIPTEAIKDMWVGEKKNLLMIGDGGVEYDLNKKMYFVKGAWKGFNVMVSSSLITKNALELMEDYVEKFGRVQDQMVEQMDLQLKKKMKGGDEVVEEENRN